MYYKLRVNGAYSMEKAIFTFLGQEDMEEYGVMRRRCTYELKNKTGDPVQDYLLFCAKVFSDIENVRIEMKPEDDVNINTKSHTLYSLQDALDFVPRLERGLQNGARFGIRGYIDVDGTVNKLWYYVERRRTSDLITLYCYDQKYMEIADE